jgi:4-alpha-glucanotransferase
MYDFLKETLAKKQWQLVSTERKAGVVFPLFSLFSKQSAGIGEITDLKLAVDWCKLTGHKILQTLPLNDTGFSASPFSSHSSIALNPIYLSLLNLKKTKSLSRKNKSLQKKFPVTERVRYSLGWEKMKILRYAFNSCSFDSKFKDFVKQNKYWLDDYSLFRALKGKHNEVSWKKWPQEYQQRKNLEKIKKENKKEILFYQWIQWQLFEQLKEVKEYATKKGILLKGDLPLFVSDDSADCWANNEFFKMNLSSGAPPDYFSPKGQAWGMPPYNWEEILEKDFNYFKKRLKYAENFYQIIRIDHVIGLFRTWCISEKKSFFDPDKEKQQKERGRRILKLIIKNTQALPCAEDLGTIPDFCRETLAEFGIPGLDVARNQRNYREIAVSTLSTHDFNLYPNWLLKQRKTINIRKNLEQISCSKDIFNIILIFEYLFLDNIIEKEKAVNYRINNPALNSLDNWSVRMPFSMEELLKHSVNKKIKEINQKGQRC